ncbi:kinase-like domain-containing protein [Flagelloscypha sp. PMI_526]|nr:kinase-like domain-containing protein [Flagelloscypha sp. PMI_526]
MPRQSSTLPDFSNLVLANRFRLLYELGQGSYAKVYKALDLHSSPRTYYAIKCLARFDTGSNRQISQAREFSLHRSVLDQTDADSFAASTSSSSSHHIIQLYDTFSDGLYVYAILQYCPGGDLFSAITTSGTYYRNDEAVRTTFLQVIDGLAKCHDRGVFHRDIKPENILLGKDGRKVFLFDFGLSTNEEWTNEGGCGSRPYMAPENVAGVKHYSSRANDIWALGVVLINLITTRYGWSCAHATDLGFRAYLHDTNYLLKLLPISHEANDVLKQILCIDPSRRIRLSLLREKILNVQSFYLSEEELERAPRLVQEAAADQATQANLAMAERLFSSSSSCSDGGEVEEAVTPETRPGDGAGNQVGMLPPGEDIPELDITEAYALEQGKAPLGYGLESVKSKLVHIIV